MCEAKCVIVVIGVVSALVTILAMTINFTSGGTNGFIILALKMGLMCTHAVHYFCLTKKLVKKKLTRAVEIEMKNVNPPVIPVPGVLNIPALP